MKSVFMMSKRSKLLIGVTDFCSIHTKFTLLDLLILVYCCGIGRYNTFWFCALVGGGVLPV